MKIEALVARTHWAARYGVLGRARSAATSAPLVLVSRSPIAPWRRSVILQQPSRSGALWRAVAHGALHPVRFTLARGMTRRFLGVPLAVMAIVLLVVTVAAGGCSRTSGSTTTAPSAAAAGAGAESESAEHTATTSANTTTGGADGQPTDSQSGGSGLSSAEAAALDAQLAAIEKELDSISLPSDDDFSGLEAELP